MQTYFQKSQRVNVPDWLFNPIRLAAGKKKKEFSVTLQDEEEEREQATPPPAPAPAAPVPPQPAEVAQPKQVDEEKIKVATEEAERKKILEEKLQQEKEEKEKAKKEKEKSERERKEKQAALLKSQQTKVKEDQERESQVATKLPPAQGKKQKRTIEYVDQDQEEPKDLDDEEEKQPIAEQKQEKKPEPAGKKKQASYQFEEDENEPDKTSQKDDKDEEADDKEEDEEEKASDPLMLNNLNTPFDAQGTKEELRNNSDQRKIWFAGMFFIVTLLGSLALWIFLFRILSMKNEHLKKVVLDLPTLGQYHKDYTEFFNSYNKITTEMQSVGALVNDEAKVKPVGLSRSATKSVIATEPNRITLFKKKEELKNSIQTMKRRLTSLLTEGRLLAGDNSVSLSAAPESKESLLDTVKKIDQTLKEFKDSISNSNNLSKEFGEQYNDVDVKLKDIYSDSLEMVDLYGSFYIKTNRIWVASENIFHLFNKRAIEISHEMIFDHYQPFSIAKDKVSLKSTSFPTLLKITDMPSLIVPTDRTSTLVCSLRADVDNSDLNSSAKIFELKMIANAQVLDQTSTVYSHQVEGLKDRFGFVQVVELPEGKNIVELYAKVPRGEIKLEKVSVGCVKFADYMKLPEYRDYRIE